MKVTLMAVGTLPKGPFSEIGEDFQKRLKKFVDFEQRTFKDEERLKEALPTGAIVMVLEATGKTFSSQAFAKKIESYLDTGERLVFILGGPHGLSDELKKSAHVQLSLSSMTTTHDLAHLFFLEQLYRAFTIVKGITYHY